jgi:hypothetical protein
MNRVNFAHCSNVIVNVCGKHGTWFDKDQLQRVVEFIRSGGIEKERAREIEDLQERERHVQSAAIADAWSAKDLQPGWSDVHRDFAISAVASVIGHFLRK